MKWFRAIANFYVYGNLHIAICAMTYVWASFVLLEMEPIPSFIVFVGCATFATYNLHRFIGLQKISKGPIQDRFLYTRNNKSILTALNIVAFGTVIYCLFEMPTALIFWLTPLALLTLLYVLPVLKNKKRLRDLPWIKIFLISLVWAFVFILPAIAIPTANVQAHQIALIGLEKTLFFLALTLPFDLRDVVHDREIKVLTLAHKLDKKGILDSISGLLGGCILIVLVLFVQGVYTSGIIIFLNLFYICLWWISRFMDAKRGEMYYLALLDGFILLHGTAIIVGTYCL